MQIVSASLTAIGLSREMLDSLPQLGAADALTAGNVFFRAVVGPRPPALLDLAQLLDDLLAPRREFVDEPTMIAEVDLDTATNDSRFSPSAIVAASRLLATTRERPRRLGDLLLTARSEEEAPARELQNLAWLRAMWAYAPSQPSARSHRRGGRYVGSADPMVWRWKQPRAFGG
jgi:hypothetical protein